MALRRCVLEARRGSDRSRSVFISSSRHLHWQHPPEKMALGVARPRQSDDLLVGELLGGRRSRPQWVPQGGTAPEDALTLQEQTDIRAELGRKYEHLPAGERGMVERHELKNKIKDEIKERIKNRLRKERQAFYDRQPKSEEERIECRIKRAHKVIGYKKLELRKYIIEQPPPVPGFHDPEVLTAEQLHYLKKVGQKSKNYIPVGKRGVYGGTVENMHMHWKKHQTVRMDCHTFSMEEAKEISQELAQLSGGIVIDIFPDKTIVMYRGRNYEQPKKLIPPNTLTKRKALKKALLEQSIASRLKYVDFLERNLKQLREQREYEERKKQLAIEFKDEAVKNVPKRIRKVKPNFKAIGDSYDFEDDSDPCSETERESDEDDDQEPGWSSEEDQGFLYTESDKQRKEMKQLRQFLIRTRQKRKRVAARLRMRREEYENFGWTR